MSKRFENAHLHNHKRAEHKQRDLTNSTLATIATNTANIKLSADSVNLNVDGVEGLLAGGLPSALTGSGNLKVCLQELGNEGSERLNVDVGSTNTKLPSALTGAGNLKVSIQEHFGAGLATESKQGGGLPSALTGSGNLKVSIEEGSSGGGDASEAKQDALITANHTDLVALEASLTSIEGKIDTLDTVLDNSLVKHTNNETLLTAANVDHAANEVLLTAIAADGDAIQTKLDTLETSANAIQSAVEGTLTVGSHAVTNAGTFAVQAACSGTVTANLSATDNAVLDAILAKNTEIETSADALIAANHTDLVALEASLTSIEGKIDTLDTVLDNSLVKHTNNETLLTAANVDHAANEVLLTAIAADGDAIQTKLDTLETSANAIQSAVEGTLTVGSHAVTNAGTFAVQAACSGTVTANLSATDNAVLDAILAKNTEIDTVLDTIKTDAMVETIIFNAQINASATGTSTAFEKPRNATNWAILIENTSTDNGNHQINLSRSVNNSHYFTPTTDHNTVGDRNNVIEILSSSTLSTNKYYKVIINNQDSSAHTYKVTVCA